MTREDLIDRSQRQIFYYYELIELGFVREELDDSVYKLRYGYDSFCVIKRLAGSVTMIWTPDKRWVDIYKTDSDDDICNSTHFIAESLEELDDLIRIFNND